MTAYVDSSVILRRLMQQPGALTEWRLVRDPVSSRLTEVECFRTLDRLRVEKKLGDAELSRLREGVHRILESIDVIEVTRSILSRAAQPSATALGTLDAVHLCSALAWRDRNQSSLVLATHDGALALAARAHGFRVIGA
jgi:predicted nucleic acid-binding protein